MLVTHTIIMTIDNDVGKSAVNDAVRVIDGLQTKGRRASEDGQCTIRKQWIVSSHANEIRYS